MSESKKNVSNHAGFNIVGLNYISFYFEAFAAAIRFYSEVFGEPEYVEDKGNTVGWRMGNTWLTFFPAWAGTAPESNPQNAEFAIQLATAADVDALYDRLIAAGASSGCAPIDTTMYEPMRYAYVDDPFGVRIDLYCAKG